MAVSLSVAERLSAVGTANALELRGVTRMFGALAALTDITLTVRPGERRAVLGSNGAGKTTLFNCITGDFPSTSGTIRFFGEDVTHFPPHERIRRGLRRTYQISALFTGLSVVDNVYLACCGVSRGRFSLLRPRRDDRLVQSAENLVQAVHLTDVKDQLVAQLSHGQQRQLEIALALAGAPRFILFDEPAAGLSPTERAELIEILTSLPAAHRLHRHRARHGRRAARGRERDDDAQRPHLQRGPPGGDRVRSGSAGALSRGRSWLTRPALLTVRGLNVYYGHSHALQGVEFTIHKGVLAIVGRNGMGKTTLCKTIMGLVRASSGSIRFGASDELTRLNPAQIARLGIGYVPQGRRLWRSLTVDEHLRVTPAARKGAWTVERIYDTFPRLAERKNTGGAQLSGGEQQMLAISRALLSNPRLLVMDEPTEGLAPVIVTQVEEMLVRLAEDGEMAVLVIEQNIGVACAVSENVAIMVNGRINRVIEAPRLAADRALQQRLLGVGRHGHDDTPIAEPAAPKARPRPRARHAHRRASMSRTPRCRRAGRSRCRSPGSRRRRAPARRASWRSTRRRAGAPRSGRSPRAAIRW